MPIAHCYLSPSLTHQADFAQLVKDWALEIGVSEKDITLNIISTHQQYGQQYQVMVNLYLPSLWPENAVKNIQESLAALLVKHLSISPQDLFIMTSIIQSGHVYSDGQTEEWE